MKEPIELTFIIHWSRENRWHARVTGNSYRYAAISSTPADALWRSLAGYAQEWGGEWPLLPWEEKELQ